jgi:hypothetical protein
MTEQGTILEGTDRLLLPFLRAGGKAEVDSSLTELIGQHAQPVIRGILRNKLKVTLSASDGRHENQEALEVESDVLAELLSELNELKAGANEKAINNFRSYAAVITFHACYRYLRRKHPQRGQLKDKLRYLLNNRPSFSLWQTRDEEWVCGFSEWRDDDRQIIRSGQLGQLLRNSPADFQSRLDGAAGGNGSIKLEALVPAVLHCAGRPVEFDEMVSTVADLQGLKNQSEQAEASGEDAERELAKLPDSRPGVAAETEQRFYLERLWKEICQLPLRQRTALLLNLKDAQGRSMISMFPLMEIAGLPQIAAALETPPAEFALLWNDLPWEDARIASHLGITRQQVVNLRKCARERLSRRMKGF